MLHLVLTVESERTCRVDTHTERTAQVVAVVVHGLSRTRIDGYTAVLGTLIDGIDRRDSVDIVEAVVHHAVAVLVGMVHRVVRVGEVDVALEPFLGLVVHIGTHGEAVEVGGLIVAFVHQISERGEVLDLLRTAVELDIGIHFLSHAEDGIFPRLEILVPGQTLVRIVELRMGQAIYQVLVDEEATVSAFIPQVVALRQTVGTEEHTVGVLVRRLDRRQRVASVAHAVVDRLPGEGDILFGTGDDIVEG